VKTEKDTPLKPFWQEKSLADMSPAEWEQLCDGCARCCVIKEQDEETDEVTYTNVACRYLDQESCLCTCYENRKRLVPDCVALSAAETEHFSWLPSTCAYRRLHEGKGLPDWHPLVTGDPQSTMKAGMSVRDRVVSETEI
jgi:uncharacterized cysteine cluster protein YcgN (CxxCxxCC family)